MNHFDIAETVNQLVFECIALDENDTGFETSAEIIINTINELLAELINLAGIEASSSDATSAVTMKETIQELVTELVSLERERVSAEPNAEANLRNIAETIDTIIADFIEINKYGIEVQSIKRMSNAELVSFTKSVLLLLFHLA